MANASGKVLEKPQGKAAQKFTKEQFLACAKYSARKDIMDALLDENKKYTKAEADTLFCLLYTSPSPRDCS